MKYTKDEIIKAYNDVLKEYKEDAYEILGNSEQAEALISSQIKTKDEFLKRLTK